MGKLKAFRLAARAVPCVIVFACGLIAEDAAKPRHIDFTQVVNDLDGNPLPILDPTGHVNTLATLGQLAKDALVNTLQEDQTLAGSVKYEHWQLAGKVYPGKTDVVLTAEEIATIKDRVGKAFGALVVGPVWNMLDPASAKAKSLPDPAPAAKH